MALFDSKDKDFFSTPSLKMINQNDKKTLSIPINTNNKYDKHISKSWNGNSMKTKFGTKKYSVSPSDIFSYKKRFKKNFLNDLENRIDDFEFIPYDAVNNCKSAGIIPYAIYNGTVYFLFQQADNPIRKKDSGWNDFGGKKIDQNESTAETAAREFSEETSCLFYLKEQNDETSLKLFNILKDNKNLYYNDESVEELKKLIPVSQKYFADKITEYVLPIYISSKETYISYFVKIEYIPEQDLPRAEDIHVPYENRYIRTCKWFNYDELMNLNEKDFHKRLQITKIQQRIQNYYEKDLFTC